MKAPAGILPALFLPLLALPPHLGLAQNLASEIGAASRGTDHLTLLPGPGLLSPARGAGVPAPNRNRGPISAPAVSSGGVSLTTAPPPLLRRSGTLVLGNSVTAFPVLTTSGTAASLPSPDLLRFKAKLESPPASLPLQPPRRLRRD